MAVAVSLGLIAVTGISTFTKNKFALPLPLSSSIPLVLLAPLLAQLLLGRLPFSSVGILFSAYLCWAALLIWMGRLLVDTIGLSRLVHILAASILMGSLMSALIALVKWSGLSLGAAWIFNESSGQVFGNLGQSNHFAHYSWLGVTSAFYLTLRLSWPRKVLWLLLLPVLFGTVVSGSRSVFIYPVVILAAMSWANRCKPDARNRELLIDAALLLPIMLALSFVAELKPVIGPSSATRLYESVSGPSVRIALARTAWSAFLEHPWVGHGAGGFPWASFVAASNPANDAPFQVAEHAHNFVLNLLVEFGAPATLAVLVLLAIWARRFLLQRWSIEHFWCGAVLGIGAVHSMLEYPLWYAYFLGPTALILGAAETGKCWIVDGRRARVYLTLILAGGALILFNLRADYTIIETATYRPLDADSNREKAWQISKDRLLTLQKESLLSPYALLAFASLAQPAREQAQHRATLCERGIRFAPARSLITRCAIQFSLSGREVDAISLAGAVLRAFPAERATTLAELKAAAEKFPEVSRLLPAM